MAPRTSAPGNTGTEAMARYDFGVVDANELAPAAMAPEAFYELGILYAAGRGVPADLVLAHKWFNIAVARGHQAAAERRAELAAEMSRDQIAAAQREARAWLQAA